MIWLNLSTFQKSGAKPRVGLAQPFLKVDFKG